jgi:hypothetical protein
MKKKRKKSRPTLKKSRGITPAPPADNGHLPSIPLHEALQSPEKIQVFREETLQWIRSQAEELEALLLRYNSFDMLANLMITQLSNNPETYKETTHMGLAAFVEYAALLYLKHPFNSGEIQAIDGPILDQIEAKMRGIFATLSFYWAAEARADAEDGQRSALDAFRYRTISNELVVRSPGYTHHQTERLRVLFEPVGEELLEHLGFTLADILAVESTIEDVTRQRLIASMEDRREAEQELLGELRSAYAGKSVHGANEEYIRQLKTLRSKQAKRHIRNSLTVWAMSFIGTKVYSFDAGEIAAEGEMPPEQVQAVLDYFSLNFSSVPADFYIPSPTHELRIRPFLHNDGTYLYPVPGSLIWAVQSRLEESINPTSPNAIVKTDKIWKRYEKTRKTYLEQETLRLLGSTLKHAEVYGGLAYQVVEDGVAKNTELDGLIAYDTTMFLVEAKAGGFSFSARRGSKDRIKRELKKLFGEAHSQALRAKRYIESTDSPTFVDSAGHKVVLDKSRFQRIFLVTVTLEPMDTFNAVLHEVARAGILEEAELPWAVSLDILRVICEVNEFPTQLVHYLQRRLRVNDFRKLRASDELDWFGHYLMHGLYFENDQQFSDSDFVQFASFSTVFDDYYLHEMGIRKTPTPKPTQPMPKMFRDIVLELDGRGESEGRSEAVLQLITWNDETRKEFVTLFKRVRKMTLHDRRLHDFSLSSDDAGITCFSTTARNADEAYKSLGRYVQIKKYQVRADQWLGLLTVVDHPGLVHGFIVGNEPWIPDEGLEALAASLPGETFKREGE